jgi:hypothetical protein
VFSYYPNELRGALIGRGKRRDGIISINLVTSFKIDNTKQFLFHEFKTSIPAEIHFVVICCCRSVVFCIQKR